ncbi:MAG: TonB-dependent receptor [Bacteroidetes bacterium]|nr:TonB-dependent receptor [Bacteroidota bacterium]
MKRSNYLLLLCFSALFLAVNITYGQGTLKGKVKDASNNVPLYGASVMVEGTAIGMATDEDGVFMLTLDAGVKKVVISYVGYEKITMDVTIQNGQVTDAGTIRLEPMAIGMAGILIVSDRARDRETPVAMSNIEKKEIVDRLGSRDIPLILNTTPSVYATAQGGGAGDARINVRGFNQRNVAIMINGVPVNDMENGWVYWSNWDGISDATSSIQVQRGLSAVNLATPSIGGTMNVITSPSEMKGGASGRFEVGSGNFMKTTISANTGLIGGKFAMSASVVRKVGNGIIDGTWTDAWAYYLGASYNINKNHRLEVYAMGAPQKHGQNIYKQNIATYSHDYAKSVPGYDTMAFTKFKEQSWRYNQNWGPVISTYNGKQAYNGKTDHDRYSPTILNERENYYHKPLANLNWYAQWNKKVSQFTTVYYSGGKGGGSGTAGSLFRRDADGVLGGKDYKYYYGPSPWSWDFTETVLANQSNEDTIWIDKKAIVRKQGQSVGILRNSVNNQWTIGAISKVKVEWSDVFRTTIGIDWRTAEIEHYREVRDLLGGMYFMDNSDEFNPNRQVVLGDKIAYNFTNNVNWIGGFLQGEYHTELITAYATVGYSTIKYKHRNHFTKSKTDPTQQLEIEADPIAGYQAKGGISYKASSTITVFGNVGYVSKVPIFDAVINDNTHELIDDPTNEKFISGEIGMNFRSNDEKFNANVNLYHTNWNDRVITDPYYSIDNNEGIFVINDLDAIHQGIEADLALQPNKYFRIDGAFSIGNWKQTNDPKATLKRYEENLPDTSFTIYVKDLKTGDAPQTQFALSGTVFPAKGLYITLSMKHFADMYADWNVINRTDPNDRTQSWKTPAYTVFDLHVGYTLPTGPKYKVQLFAHIFNLFNTMYIQDAVDNSQYNSYMGADNRNTHSAAAAEVYLGLPRWFNTGIQLSF